MDFYHITYSHNNGAHETLVEAPAPKAAERYLLSKNPYCRLIRTREATQEDRKLGAPVLILSEREQKSLRETFLSQGIDELDLSVRTYNSVRRAGVETVGDIISKSAGQVQKFPNLGWKGFDEIVTLLNAHGETLSSSPVHIAEEANSGRAEQCKKPPLDERIVSVAHFAETKEMRDELLASDALRRQTLDACYAIPGYTKLSLQDKNALYDLVKKSISLSHTQGKETASPTR